MPSWRPEKRPHHPGRSGRLPPWSFVQHGALGDSLAALENWYYGQITRGEPLYPPEYGKVLTSAVSLDEVRQTLQSYSYSVCYAVTAEPGTQGKGGSEDVE